MIIEFRRKTKQGSFSIFFLLYDFYAVFIRLSGYRFTLIQSKSQISIEHWINVWMNGRTTDRPNEWMNDSLITKKNVGYGGT